MSDVIVAAAENALVIFFLLPVCVLRRYVWSIVAVALHVDELP